MKATVAPNRFGSQVLPNFSGGEPEVLVACFEGQAAQLTLEFRDLKSLEALRDELSRSIARAKAMHDEATRIVAEGGFRS